MPLGSVKWSGGIDPMPPFSAMVKNVWSYTFSPSYVFMALWFSTGKLYHYHMFTLYFDPDYVLSECYIIIMMKFSVFRKTFIGFKGKDDYPRKFSNKKKYNPLK
jgi:hypothetical protein